MLQFCFVYNKIISYVVIVKARDKKKGEMGKETVVSEGEALGRELNSNYFLDLSLKPNSLSIKELVETLIERIAEAREQSPSNQRKQRKSAIEQQRYILGRLISNFVYNHEKNVNYSFFVPVNKSIAFKKKR